MSGKNSQMKRFFSRLSYSFGNEDWRTEREALQILPGNKVLCISASGDRSLNLLLDDCESLTSVDANPIQNYLLNLKSAAMKSFDYEDYIGFLGGIPHQDREFLFNKLLPTLTKETGKFWVQNKKMIDKGVLYQGNVEKILRGVSRIFLLVRPRKMKKIFEINSLEDQKKYLTTWDTYLFRKIFDMVLSPRICRLLAIDPGLYVHADPSLGLGNYIYKRMIRSLNYTLAKDNLLFSLIFRGYIEPSAFPPYLNHEGYKVIRQRIDRLHTTTNDVIKHLEGAADNTYDRFSLSDVASYLSREDFNALIKNIYRTARPGARFCIRQFSSNQQIPEEYQKFFQRDKSLEQRLEEEDQCFVYRFIVGEIKKQ